MRAKAVICRELNQPVVVEEIEVEGPRPGEALIKLAACGVCHSDLSATNGTIPFPPPVILGHEGAGVVVEVGAGVTEVAPGDHVLSSFVTMCGTCRYCTLGRPGSATWAPRPYTPCRTAVCALKIKTARRSMCSLAAG